jgi:hypothetical protein
MGECLPDQLRLVETPVELSGFIVSIESNKFVLAEFGPPQVPWASMR